MSQKKVESAPITTNIANKKNLLNNKVDIQYQHQFFYGSRQEHEQEKPCIAVSTGTKRNDRYRNGKLIDTYKQKEGEVHQSEDKVICNKIVINKNVTSTTMQEAMQTAALNIQKKINEDVKIQDLKKDQCGAAFASVVIVPYKDEKGNKKVKVYSASLGDCMVRAIDMRLHENKVSQINQLHRNSEREITRGFLAGSEHEAMLEIDFQEREYILDGQNPMIITVESDGTENLQNKDIINLTDCLNNKNQHAYLSEGMYRLSTKSDDITVATIDLNAIPDSMFDHQEALCVCVADGNKQKGYYPENWRIVPEMVVNHFANEIINNLDVKNKVQPETLIEGQAKSTNPFVPTLKDVKDKKYVCISFNSNLLTELALVHDLNKKQFIKLIVDAPNKKIAYLLDQEEKDQNSNFFKEPLWNLLLQKIQSSDFKTQLSWVDEPLDLDKPWELLKWENREPTLQDIKDFTSSTFILTDTGFYSFNVITQELKHHDLIKGELLAKFKKQFSENKQVLEHKDLEFIAENKVSVGNMSYILFPVDDLQEQISVSSTIKNGELFYVFSLDQDKLLDENKNKNLLDQVVSAGIQSHSNKQSKILYNKNKQPTTTYQWGEDKDPLEQKEKDVVIQEVESPEKQFIHVIDKVFENFDIIQIKDVYNTLLKEYNTCVEKITFKLLSKAQWEKVVKHFSVKVDTLAMTIINDSTLSSTSKLQKLQDLYDFQYKCMLKPEKEKFQQVGLSGFSGVEEKENKTEREGFVEHPMGKYFELVIESEGFLALSVGDREISPNSQIKNLLSKLYTCLKDIDLKTLDKEFLCAFAIKAITSYDLSDRDVRDNTIKVLNDFIKTVAGILLSQQMLTIFTDPAINRQLGCHSSVHPFYKLFKEGNLDSIQEAFKGFDFKNLGRYPGLYDCIVAMSSVKKHTLTEFFNEKLESLTDEERIKIKFDVLQNKKDISGDFIKEYYLDNDFSRKGNIGIDKLENPIYFINSLKDVKNLTNKATLPSNVIQQVADLIKGDYENLKSQLCHEVINTLDLKTIKDIDRKMNSVGLKIKTDSVPQINDFKNETGSHYIWSQKNNQLYYYSVGKQELISVGLTDQQCASINKLLKNQRDTERLPLDILEKMHAIFQRPEPGLSMMGLINPTNVNILIQKIENDHNINEDQRKEKKLYLFEKYLTNIDQNNITEELKNNFFEFSKQLLSGDQQDHHVVANILKNLVVLNENKVLVYNNLEKMEDLQLKAALHLMSHAYDLDTKNFYEPLKNSALEQIGKIEIEEEKKKAVRSILEHFSKQSLLQYEDLNFIKELVQNYPKETLNELMYVENSPHNLRIFEMVFKRGGVLLGNVKEKFTLSDILTLLFRAKPSEKDLTILFKTTEMIKGKETKIENELITICNNKCKEHDQNLTDVLKKLLVAERKNPYINCVDFLKFIAEDENLINQVNKESLPKLLVYNRSAAKALVGRMIDQLDECYDRLIQSEDQNNFPALKTIIYIFQEAMAQDLLSDVQQKNSIKNIAKYLKPILLNADKNLESINSFYTSSATDYLSRDPDAFLKLTKNDLFAKAIFGEERENVLGELLKAFFHGEKHDSLKEHAPQVAAAFTLMARQAGLQFQHVINMQVIDENRLPKALLLLSYYQSLQLSSTAPEKKEFYAEIQKEETKNAILPLFKSPEIGQSAPVGRTYYDETALLTLLQDKNLANLLTPDDIVAIFIENPKMCDKIALHLMKHLKEDHVMKIFHGLLTKQYVLDRNQGLQFGSVLVMNEMLKKIDENKLPAYMNKICSCDDNAVEQNKWIAGSINDMVKKEKIAVYQQKQNQFHAGAFLLTIIPNVIITLGTLFIGTKLAMNLYEKTKDAFIKPKNLAVNKSYLKEIGEIHTHEKGQEYTQARQVYKLFKSQVPKPKDNKKASYKVVKKDEVITSQYSAQRREYKLDFYHQLEKKAKKKYGNDIIFQFYANQPNKLFIMRTDDITRKETIVATIDTVAHQNFKFNLWEEDKSMQKSLERFIGKINKSKSDEKGEVTKISKRINF